MVHYYNNIQKTTDNVTNNRLKKHKPTDAGKTINSLQVIFIKLLIILKF